MEEKQANKHSVSGKKNEITLSLQVRRRLLKRSKALTMDLADRVGLFKSSLLSLPEAKALSDNANDEVKAFPSLPDSLLVAVGMHSSCAQSNKNLNEPDIEERFARLALAFKTDKFTLNKRLDLQRRQRNTAEENIERELDSLRKSLNALNQLCTESDMREIITKTQQFVDIVQEATFRMSGRAETYGAIQQEERMNCAFETMLNYVEHLKLLYDKEHLELEEYRRLLAEHNLLPGEKGSSEGDDTKRFLPPRSHSLTSSSKPEIIRRSSVGALIRLSHSENFKMISREKSNNSHFPTATPLLNLVKQKLDNRTRLLSSVCLLNNNYESPRSPQNGSSSLSPGSVSPKSRRSSLPVGSTSGYGNNHSPSTGTSLSIRNQNNLNELSEKKRRESQIKPPLENESRNPIDGANREESGDAVEEEAAENIADKDMI